MQTQQSLSSLQTLSNNCKAVEGKLNNDVLEVLYNSQKYFMGNYRKSSQSFNRRFEDIHHRT